MLGIFFNMADFQLTITTHCESSQGSQQEIYQLSNNWRLILCQLGLTDVHIYIFYCHKSHNYNIYHKALPHLTHSLSLSFTHTQTASCYYYFILRNCSGHMVWFSSSHIFSRVLIHRTRSVILSEQEPFSSNEYLIWGLSSIVNKT